MQLNQGTPRVGTDLPPRFRLRLSCFLTPNDENHVFFSCTKRDKSAFTIVVTNHHFNW